MGDWLARHKDPKSTGITDLGSRHYPWDGSPKKDDLLRVCHRGCGHSSLGGREVKVPGSQKSSVWDAKEAMKKWKYTGCTLLQTSQERCQGKQPATGRCWLLCAAAIGHLRDCTLQKLCTVGSLHWRNCSFLEPSGKNLRNPGEKSLPPQVSLQRPLLIKLNIMLGGEGDHVSFWWGGSAWIWSGGNQLITGA